MRFDLEEADLERIAAMAADKVVEALKPLMAKAKASEDPLLTVDSCAAYLHVSPAWLYKRTSLKEIPFIKLGRLVMFRRSELDAWILRKGQMPQCQELSAKLRIVEK